MTVAPERPFAPQAVPRQQAHRDRVEAAFTTHAPAPRDHPLERLLRGRRPRTAEAAAPPALPAPRLAPREPRPAPAERVQTILDRLGDGWWVLDGIAIGDRGTVIDHLVVGPGGVFTVAAHHHDACQVLVEGESVSVDGQRQPHVRGSEHEARRAARLLSAAVGRPVGVSGVLALVAGRVTVRAQPAGVVVVEGRSVPRFLGRQQTVLGETEIAEVVAAARRRSTWQVSRPAR